MACLVDIELFGPARAPLFPGRQQHWVLAFLPDNNPNIDDETRVRLFESRYLKELGAFDVMITGRQTGTPSTIAGKQVARVLSHVAVPPNQILPSTTRYIAIAFDLPKDAPDSMPWPWRPDRCANLPSPLGITQVRAGLWSVFQSAQSVIIKQPSPFEETVDQVLEDVQEVGKKAKEAAGSALGAVSIGAGLIGAWLLVDWLKKK